MYDSEGGSTGNDIRVLTAEGSGGEDAFTMHVKADEISIMTIMLII